MTRTVLCVLLLLAAGPALAEPTTLYDGHLTIDTPRGFREASEAEILSKYPRPQRPDHVFTENERLQVTIAVRRNPLPPQVALTPVAQLGASVVQGQIAPQPGITLHRHGPVTINGREWYAIEFASAAPDAQIENVLRLTVIDGQLVIVSVNAIKTLFDQYEEALRATLESVAWR
jgi:hypothetical protein